jgi:NAD(P)-dependent dehydrogenase (short-subunit alcohol dehydrogenase family)
MITLPSTVCMSFALAADMSVTLRSLLMGNLEGGVVIISGGGSGIGRATATRAAHEGAAVAVVDKHADNAEETAAMIRGAGGRASAHPCDVGDDAAVSSAVGAAASGLGRITGVVTAAGIFHGPDLQLAHQVSVDDFVTVLRVNLVGTFAVIKHALPFLVDGGGAIVTIASTAAIRGHGFGAGYTASKGGVDALTRLLAVQYGKHGVRANCICPGGVDTPMTGGTFTTPEAVERAKRTVPIGHHAQPEDIGDVAVFLLTDDARHLTGVTLPVEGGATIA